MYRPTRDTRTVRQSVPQAWGKPVSDEPGATITVTAPPAKGDKRTGEQKRIEELFQSLNPGDSIKIRHELRSDQGKHVRPLTAILRDFNGVTDLEQHIYETGCEQGWKSGDYMIELCRPGVQGAVKYGFFSFTFPEKPGAAAAVDPLAVLERAKGILGPSAAPASADATLSAVTQALKVGAESAKPSAVPSETLVMLKPVLEKLVDRLMVPPAAAAAAPDPIAQMRGMVGALRELGLIGDAGSNGAAEEPKSLRDQLAEVKELAETLGLSARGGAAEPTAVMVAKVLAPLAERVVPQVLATINNVVDVWRLRMTIGVGGLPSGPRPMPAAPVPVAIPPAITALVANAQAAVARDDDTYFGAFADGIATHIPDGRGFLEAVQRGQVEEEQALAVVQGSGLLPTQEPKTRAWLLRFVHWLRKVAPPPTAAPAPPVPKVMGKCGTCGADYEFDSREQFEADSRICDEQRDGQPCAGLIALVEPPA